jgi:hypothetical protein
LVEGAVKLAAQAGLGPYMPRPVSGLGDHPPVDDAGDQTLDYLALIVYRYTKHQAVAAIWSQFLANIPVPSIASAIRRNNLI